MDKTLELKKNSKFHPSHLAVWFWDIAWWCSSCCAWISF